MGEFHFSTEDSLDGPWLLDTQALLLLDSIIDKYWRELEERRIKLYYDALEAERLKVAHQTRSDSEYYKGIDDFNKENVYYRNLRFVTVYYERFSYECENFAIAFQDISISDRIPLGFLITLISGDVSCQVHLRSDDDVLEISVLPESLDATRKFFTELENWAKQNYGPWWLRQWGKLARKKVISYIYLGIVPLILTYLYQFIQFNNNILNAQQRAQELLEVGISDQNIPEVLALLLRVQIVDRFSIQFYPSLFIFLGLVTLGIVFSIRPRVVLGIGRGAERLKRWKRWLSFISIAVPGFILTFIILPRFADWIIRVFDIP